MTEKLSAVSGWRSFLSINEISEVVAQCIVANVLDGGGTTVGSFVTEQRQSMIKGYEIMAYN
jgi:hypothetical protein